MIEKTSLSARFVCFAKCAASGEKSYPLTQAIYRCPDCGGLLAVRHDLNALAQTSAAEWKKLFDERFRVGKYPLASGVWGKKEWVAPELPEDDIVSTMEGATPLVRCDRFAREHDFRELYVKQCGTSHSGSFKDLGMTVLVSVVNWALRIGSLNVKAIACASTGDTSAALAAYGAMEGLPIVVLLPKGLVSTAQLVQPLAHGATVLSIDTDFDGCMKVVQELAKRGVVYLANSMNPLRIEGQKTVAIEVAQQLQWSVPDWIVLPSGNLGNAAALFSGFQMMLTLGLIDRIPRLCVAQAERANPMYRAFTAGEKVVSPMVAQTTAATAIRIGNPVSAPRAMAALAGMNGVVEQASEDELANACAEADRAGLYTCPHTGVALACAIKLRSKDVIKKTDQVVVVSTASGLKFTEFKLGYHEKKLPDVDARLANTPVEVSADVDAIAKRIEAL
ncbi:MAG: threonine synthase [Polyangiaceae bacterium]